MWNDPSLNIPWRAKETDAVLSGKDKTAPLLVNATEIF